METLDERSLALSKASVIHSTLVEAATDIVSITGQAGHISRHCLSLSNPTDSAMVVYAPKLSNRFSFQTGSRNFKLGERGQGCFELAAFSELEIELQFFPIAPQADFDYAIDFTTPEGSIFRRFCLRGYVTSPNVYQTLRVVESERVKIKRRINLPVPLSKETQIVSVVQVSFLTF